MADLASVPAAKGQRAPSLASSSGVPKYLKFGVVERLWEDEGGPSGRAFHPYSKGIATFLVGRAQWRLGYRCVVTDDEIKRKLSGTDEKTIRKYLQPLVDAKLIGVRLVHRCKKEYDLLPLFRYYGEERLDPPSKVSSLHERKALGEMEVAPAASELTLFGDEACARLGLDKSCAGFEPELRGIIEYVTAWGRGDRFLRRVLRRYGIPSVAGAVGYVAFQLRAGAPGSVKDPIGLFMHALDKGYSNEIPCLSAEVGKDSGPGAAVDASRDNTVPGEHQAIWDFVEARTTQAFVRLAHSASTIDLSDGVLCVTCAHKFLMVPLLERGDHFVAAAKALYGIDVDFTVSLRPDDPGGERSHAQATGSTPTA